jgi:hypothetical protein
MMLLICVPMMFRRKEGRSSDQSASQAEVAELREEVARLRAERGLADKSESLDA